MNVYTNKKDESSGFYHFYLVHRLEKRKLEKLFNYNILNSSFFLGKRNAKFQNWKTSGASDVLVHKISSRCMVGLARASVQNFTPINLSDFDFSLANI